MEHKPYHGGNLWEAAQKFGIKPQDFIDFSANINPLGPSPKAIQKIKSNLEMIRHYPQPGAEELKSELAGYLGIPEENLLLGNGAAELIYMLGRHFDSRRIVLAAPCFSEYGEGSLKSEFKYIDLGAEDGFAIKANAFMPEIKPGDVVYIGNPNNPTATLTPPDELLRIFEECQKKGATLVVDEAFIDFVDEEEKYTLRHEACKQPEDCCVKNSGLIVLGSLTKFFALPGLRLGYLVSSAENIKFFEKLLPTWRINSLAQVAGVASLNDQEYIQRTKINNKKEREFLLDGLQKINGIKPYRSHANFILVNCKETGRDIHQIQNYLGLQGILIRRCDTYRNLDEYYLRLAVRLRGDNERLLELLERYLGVRK